eukprot:g2743.t1
MINCAGSSTRKISQDLLDRLNFNKNKESDRAAIAFKAAVRKKVEKATSLDLRYHVSSLSRSDMEEMSVKGTSSSLAAVSIGHSRIENSNHMASSSSAGAVNSELYAALKGNVSSTVNQNQNRPLLSQASYAASNNSHTSRIRSFQFMRLPGDLQQLIVQYLRVTELGKLCEVSRHMRRHVFEEAASSMFVQIVGAPKPTFNLGRTQLTLLYRLRHIHMETHATQILLWACSQGYLHLVKKILDRDPHLIEVSATGIGAWDAGKPVHIAIQHDQYGVLEELIKRGADLNSKNASGKTPIYMTCEKGRPRLLEMILKSPSAYTKETGIDVNIESFASKTPFWVACARGHTQIVRLLLNASTTILDELDREIEKRIQEEGEDEVDSVDGELEEDITRRLTPDIEKGHPELGTPICISCGRGQVSTAKLLVDAGVNVNTSTQDGRTPLYLASERNMCEVIEMLLKERPPFSSYKAFGHSMSPLRDARPENFDEHLDLPPSSGIALSEARRERRRLRRRRLNFAARTGVNVDSNISQQDQSNSSNGTGGNSSSAVMIEGVDMDKCTSSGKTPLFAACENGHVEATEMLVQNGACLSKPTYLNKIPLYIAAENNFEDCVAALLPRSTKEDVLRSTNYGTTAIFIATRNGNPRIKRMLTEFCLSHTEQKQARTKKKIDGRRQSEYMSRLTKKPKLKVKRKSSSSSLSKSQRSDLNNELEALEKEDRQFQKEWDNTQKRIKDIEAEIKKLKSSSDSSDSSSKKHKGKRNASERSKQRKEKEYNETTMKKKQQKESDGQKTKDIDNKTIIDKPEFRGSSTRKDQEVTLPSSKAQNKKSHAEEMEAARLRRLASIEKRRKHRNSDTEHGETSSMRRAKQRAQGLKRESSSKSDISETAVENKLQRKKSEKNFEKRKGGRVRKRSRSRSKSRSKSKGRNGANNHEGAKTFTTGNSGTIGFGKGERTQKQKRPSSAGRVRRSISNGTIHRRPRSAGSTRRSVSPLSRIRFLSKTASSSVNKERVDDSSSTMNQVVDLIEQEVTEKALSTQRSNTTAGMIPAEESMQGTNVDDEYLDTSRLSQATRVTGRKKEDNGERKVGQQRRKKTNPSPYATELVKPRKRYQSRKRGNYNTGRAHHNPSTSHSNTLLHKVVISDFMSSQGQNSILSQADGNSYSLPLPMSPARIATLKDRNGATREHDYAETRSKKKSKSKMKKKREGTKLPQVFAHATPKEIPTTITSATAHEDVRVESQQRKETQPQEGRTATSSVLQCIAQRSLSSIHNCLLKFSEETSGFKMNHRLFCKVYTDKTSENGPSDEVIDKAFASLCGETQHTAESFVDAFECFVSTALLADASIDERLQFCFGLFDLEGTGELVHDDVMMLIKCCANGISKVTRSVHTDLNRLVDSESQQILNELEDIKRLNRIASSAFQRASRGGSVQKRHRSLSAKKFVHWATGPQTITLFHKLLDIVIPVLIDLGKEVDFDMSKVDEDYYGQDTENNIMSDSPEGDDDDDDDDDDSDIDVNAFRRERILRSKLLNKVGVPFRPVSFELYDLIFFFRVPQRN